MMATQLHSDDEVRECRASLLQKFAHAWTSHGRCHTAKGLGWRSWAVDETSTGWEYSESHGTYALPIEEMMLAVLTLELEAGRAPIEAQRLTYERVDQFASLIGPSALCLGLPEAEAIEFEQDLRVIGRADLADAAARGRAQSPSNVRPFARPEAGAYNAILLRLGQEALKACRAKFTQAGECKPWIPGELAVGYAHAALQQEITQPAQRLMLDATVLCAAAGRLAPSVSNPIEAELRALCASIDVVGAIDQLLDDEQYMMKANLNVLARVGALDAVPKGLRQDR